MADVKQVDQSKGAETKREAFVRLAEARTGRAIQAIGRLAPLSNRSQYEYTKDDVATIEHALTSMVERTVDALEGRGARGFSLKGGSSK